MSSISGFASSETLLYPEERSLSFVEEPDPQQIEKEVAKPLKDRVTLLETVGNFSVYSLDHCLKIRLPSEIFRNKMALYWKNADQFWRQYVLETFVIGAAVIILTSFVSVRLPLIACIVTATLVYTRVRKKNLASEQEEKWSRNPLTYFEKLSDDRALAYQSPFTRLYLSIKQDILHVDEVKYLYKKYMNNFCKKFLDWHPSNPQEEAQWVHDFLWTFSPLAPWTMKYGLKTVPQELYQVTIEYLTLRSKHITPGLLGEPFAKPAPMFETLEHLKTWSNYPKTTYLNELEALVVNFEKHLHGTEWFYKAQKEQLRAKFADKLLLHKHDLVGYMFQYDWLIEHYNNNARVVSDEPVAKPLLRRGFVK